jgi:hypothetical protein
MEEHHITIHEGHPSIVYEMVEEEGPFITWSMVGYVLLNLMHIGVFVVGLMMFIPVHPFNNVFIILGFVLMVVSLIGLLAFNGYIRYLDSIKISFVAFICVCLMCITL